MIVSRSGTVAHASAVGGLELVSEPRVVDQAGEFENVDVRDGKSGEMIGGTGAVPSSLLVRGAPPIR
jgi:hypothetical protein